MTDFVLDSVLAGDSLPICDLPLCSVRLIRDTNFPWLLLVPRRANASEIIDLPEPERATLMTEIALACEALRACVACDKLNVAALGNQVAQLHIHIVARRRGDAVWPKPVWGQLPAAPYEPDAAEALIARLRDALLPARETH